MSVAAFLSELRNRDVEVWLEGDQLRCSAPAGVLTPELRGRLSDYNQDIREFLRSAHAIERQEPAIVPIQKGGGGIPVFAVPGHNGDVFTYCALAQCLGKNQPFFGLQPPGLIGGSQPATRVEDLASYFATQILAFRPRSQYIIAGFCAGGAVAFELAQELARRGATVNFVALFGCPYPTFFRFPVRLAQQMIQRAKLGLRNPARLASQSWQACRRIADKHFRRNSSNEAGTEELLALRARLERETLRAVRRYVPTHFGGRVCLFLPSREWAHSGFAALRWRSVTEQVEEHFGPDGCSGDNMLREPNAPVFGEFFRNCCESARVSAA